MKFRIIADATFDADNIDHAFIKLEDHFRQLFEGNDSSLELIGKIEIYKET